MQGSKQRGMSIIGALTGLFFAALVVSFSLKVTPAYLDDYALQRILSSLDEQAGTEPATVGDIRARVNKGLQTNLVELGAEEMKIFRSGDGIVVDIDYERRVNFLYNIDLILTFKHDWKAKNQ